MKIISFNSYKGGSCRTTTCYNVLPYLAKKLGATSHQPILVFDTDLDSMGLTNLLDKNNNFIKASYSAQNLFLKDKDNICYQIKDYALTTVEESAWYFNSHFNKVGNMLGLEDDGSVLFCGADMDADNISDDTFKKIYENDCPLSDLILGLNNMEEEDRPKAIIFDCAAGMQLSTLLILSKVNTFVMCMRPTYQFRVGTKSYILKKIPGRLRNKGRRRDLILLPTAVASVDEKTTNEIRELRTESYRDITNIVNDVDRMPEDSLGYRLDDSLVESAEKMGIPEVQRFKWKEQLLYTIENPTSDELKLKDRYIKLADAICK